MLKLSENREKLSCSLAFPDHRTLEMVMNKSRLISHAAEHTIPCPETAFIERAEDIQDISHLRISGRVKTLHRQRWKRGYLHHIT